MNYKSEIIGKANVVLRFAQGLEIAMQEGWDDPDTMLAPSHVDQVRRALTDARRIIGKVLQNDFKKFEAVADARKITTGV